MEDSYFRQIGQGRFDLHVAKFYGCTQRLETIFRHKFVSNNAFVACCLDCFHNGRIVNFLPSIKVTTPRNAAGVIVTEDIFVFADRVNNVALPFLKQEQNTVDILSKKIGCEKPPYLRWVRFAIFRESSWNLLDIFPNQGYNKSNGHGNVSS